MNSQVKLAHTVSNAVNEKATSEDARDKERMFKTSREKKQNKTPSSVCAAETIPETEWSTEN